MSWERSVWLLPSQTARSSVASPSAATGWTATIPSTASTVGLVRRDVGLRGALRAAGWPRTSRAEVGVELVGGDVGRRVRGQHPVVDAAPLHAEERRRDGQQDDARPRRSPRSGGASRRGPAGPTQPCTSSTATGRCRRHGSRPPSTLRPSSRSTAGQHGERGQHRDHDRRDAAVAHAAQERLREDQQAGQGRGHGEPGEQHGAAGGRPWSAGSRVAGRPDRRRAARPAPRGTG